MTTFYFYPLQARFVNPISKTIRNAFFVMILNFPKSLLIILVYAIPCLMVIFASYFIPAVLLFGFTVPGYVAVKLYSKVFAKISPKEVEISEDMDFRIQDEDVAN